MDHEGVPTAAEKLCTLPESSLPGKKSHFSEILLWTFSTFVPTLSRRKLRAHRALLPGVLCSQIASDTQ
jgi:hypothetical protein